MPFADRKSFRGLIIVEKIPNIFYFWKEFKVRSLRIFCKLNIFSASMKAFFNRIPFGRFYKDGKSFDRFFYLRNYFVVCYENITIDVPLDVFGFFFFDLL